ncbi:MAG: glycosyltransferase family 39 protein [Planctomycetes bacterium]|nr:glycosyltransferase family 39 protein [Planctomycetota bacterium]
MGRKSRHHIKTVEQAGPRSSVVPIIFAVILAMIPFCYGKFLEFGTDGPFDGSLNAYSAKCLLNGQKMGVDTFPSARPATLLVNVIGVGLFGFSELGPKLIQMLMQIAAFGLMYYTVRRIYGSLAACVSLVMCAFYLSCPPFAKFGNVKEQFMVACMIVTACGVMLRYFKGSPKWLIVSGAFAINIYFFKPTGVSVIAAVAVYMIVQLVLRRCRFKEFYKDICLLIEGAFIGLLPLFVMYVWQGQLKKFFGTIPVQGVLFGAALLLAVFGIYKLVSYCRSDWQRARLWVVCGLVLLLVVLLMPWGKVVGKGEGKTFIENTPFGMFAGAIKTFSDKVSGQIFPSSGYIAGSRKATTFRSQYANVVGYLRSFVVPIGLSLLAIGWWFKVGVKKRLTRSEQMQTIESGDESIAESFVVLLAVWWLLDMLLIWMSPRSYVEYYLPLNGSAAMLGAYAISKARLRPGGFIVLMFLPVVLEFIFSMVIPLEGFPYFSIQSAQASSEFWTRLGVCASIATGLVFLNLAMKKNMMHLGRAVLIGVACIGVCVWWNAANIKVFAGRVENIAARDAGAWQQTGLYIRSNSQPDDGLYVWGWIPGIYVKAQRFSPTARPSYSDMHSDIPGLVGGKVKQTVIELSKKPPKFIVDAGKLHFPYYDHPNFDLWPGWSLKFKGAFYMKYDPGPIEIARRLTLKEMREYAERYYQQVEGVTFKLLTNPRRKGGAIAEDQAKEMAGTEAERHRSMGILREFVMSNYVPDRSIGGINIYRLKE